MEVANMARNRKEIRDFIECTELKVRLNYKEKGMDIERIMPDRGEKHLP